MITHQFDFELNLTTQTNDFVIEVKDFVELNKLFWRTYQRELGYSHEGPKKKTNMRIRLSFSETNWQKCLYYYLIHNWKIILYIFRVDDFSTSSCQA